MLSRRNGSNYNINMKRGLQGFREFKKMLLLNTIIHIISLLFLFPVFLQIVSGVASFTSIIICPILLIINVYCIMLQRYNQIRINEILKRGEAREQRQKLKLSDELKTMKLNEKNIDDYTYEVIDESKKEVLLTFEEFLNNATLQQLRLYKEYIQNYGNASIIESGIDIELPIDKDKTLKLNSKIKC